MIGQAVHDIDQAQRVEELARRRTVRLRQLVRLIDASIEACEEAHLLRIKHPTPELATRGRTVAAVADDLLVGDAVVAVGGAGERLAAGAARRITELMDDLWLMQEAALNRLIPVRATLPDDADEPAASAARRAA